MINKQPDPAFRIMALFAIGMFSIMLASIVFGDSKWAALGIGFFGGGAIGAFTLSWRLDKISERKSE